MRSNRQARPSRRTVLGWCAAAGVWATGCTRTIYLVRNPDGTVSEWSLDGDRDASTVTTPDGLSVQMLPASPYVLEGEPIHLMLTIEGPPPIDTTRSPINVAFVMDRSGSMRGAKLEGTKDAVVHLLDGLRPGDGFSLVSYASDIRLDVPPTAVSDVMKQRARRAVEAIEAAGGTDVQAGLTLGFEQLHARRPTDSLSRVILLSDGRPTLGDTSPRRLSELVAAQRDHGASLTTMGFGLDYNEALMTRLATVGDGEYYYVEHAASLTSALTEEIGSFGAAVGRDVECLIELPPHVRLERVHGYRFRQKGRTLRIPMAHVAAGQRRRLLISLRPDRNFIGTTPVAKTVVRYREVASRKHRRLVLAPVHVRLTRDHTLAARSSDVRVVEKLEAVRNAYARQHVLTQLDRGDFDGAGRTLIERREQMRGRAQTAPSKAMQQELRRLERIRRQLERRPPPHSDSYKRLRKATSKEAFDMLRY